MQLTFLSCDVCIKPLN